MSEVIEDTGWQESGHGYMMRSMKVKNVKGFNKDDLKDTWCMSIPDMKGGVLNFGGHWIDGKMIEEWRTESVDPFHNPKQKSQ